MKKATLFSLVLILLASLALMTACSGGNEADKAYEAWAAESVPKEKAASETLLANFKAAQERGDRATMVAELETYLNITKPVREQLAAIDKTKLSDKYKSIYEDELARIDESIKSLEDNLAMQKEILAEEQGALAAEEPADAETGMDEGVDEEYYDEAEEEE